ncbi:Uncharacterised protein [Yersinia pseudotuberculosis]|nr:putative membrane protein [Yersinia pestis]KNX88180.1 putative membrane protein [Yersinia pestis]SUB31341.1 Uncharacterised protein [Yersinia pseudotuberculosis]SUQ38171.1 Uncharacterised protein [Yersinia pseudotuberculosis]
MKKHPIKADNKSILGRLSPIIFFNFFYGYLLKIPIHTQNY